MTEKSQSEQPAREAMRPGDVAPPGTPGTGEAPCPVCRGTGIAAGRTCEECGGTGIIIQGIGGA